MSDLTVFKTPYNESTTTAAMRNVPRFGHTNDFSSLFTDDDSQVEDYAVGLIFMSAFMMGAFTLWMFLLLIFKCCCRRGGTASFLSGNRFQNPTTAYRIRVIYVNVVLLFIVFTILLVMNGLTNLQDTLQTLSNTNQEVDSVLTDAQTITSSLRKISQSSETIRDVLVQNLGNFCPGDPDLTDKTGFDFDLIATEAVQMLNLLGDFFTNRLVTVEDAIDSTRQTTVQVDEQIEQIEINDWQSLLIIIPNVLIPSFLLVGCTMAWCRVSNVCYDFTLAWLLTPLLILSNIFSIIMCAFIPALAVANADFCSGQNPEEGFVSESPDGTVMNILAAQGFDREDITMSDSTNISDSGFVFEAVRFYISQCKASDPFSFIQDYQGEISLAAVQVTQLKEALNAVTVPTLNLFCDKDFTQFQALVNNMSDNLRILETNAEAALSLVGCDRITPIYNNAVYGGTCTYSIDGITWTFASFLVLAFMGMMMLTFRSSVYEDNVNEELKIGELGENYTRSVDISDDQGIEESGITKTNIDATSTSIEARAEMEETHPAPTAPPIGP
eukprot:CAMPEP_0202451340 /NCGR_PEP_ID=MMETSP1360-20130828/9797_1 /ASSEMBLY_ACC=CAM_ASM_000848 /TAXON_ID=515479 /ORGANISM="Licmophora paradoxa, Strain CCMP2313" /LENGTH=555 /DNA_ID=CAMNT_0049069895 /DNA_START=58 /DNA_END=1725 /DNA_ORIENTATION=-